MGLQIFDNEAQKALVRLAKKIFADRGWKIIVLTGSKYDRRIDFVAQIDKLKLNISCSDDSVRAYKGPEDIYESIVEYTGRIRGGRGETIVWILESELPLHSNTQLSEESIAVFLPDEIERVARLDRFINELPIDISTRETLLLAKNFEMCMQIARNFLDSEHSEKAIEWFTKATHAFAGFSSAYLQLFRLYRQAGNLDSAEETALLALKLSQNNSNFLQGLIEIEEIRGRPDKVAMWKEKLKQAPDKPTAPRNFDELMKLSSSRSKTVNQNQPAPEKRSSWLQRWFVSSKVAGS